jgi:hypothetical protein
VNRKYLVEVKLIGVVVHTEEVEGLNINALDAINKVERAMRVPKVMDAIKAEFKRFLLADWYFDYEAQRVVA